jgi:hypothetical protein
VTTPPRSRGEVTSTVTLRSICGDRRDQANQSQAALQAAALAAFSSAFSTITGVS